MQFTGTLLEALAFAVDKHRHHRRKDRRLSPYVHHLIDVVHLLYQTGKVREESLLVAAILHDTLEDTNTQPEEIQQQFGEDVLNYVREVTDNKSLPQQARKRLQVLTSGAKSEGARLIQLADKAANLQDLAKRPPAGWGKERRHAYALWAKDVIAGIRGTNAELEQEFDARVEAVLSQRQDDTNRFVPQPSV